MKTSALISLLQKSLEENGDILVYASDFHGYGVVVEPTTEFIKKNSKADSRLHYDDLWQDSIRGNENKGEKILVI